jgi:enoyl-CoA hydratase/carnithine racemase
MLKSSAVRLVSGSISRLVLSRGPVNAMNRQFLIELRNAFETIKAEPSIKAVLIQSDQKCFSAGVDLKFDFDVDSHDQVKDFASLLVR